MAKCFLSMMSSTQKHRFFLLLAETKCSLCEFMRGGYTASHEPIGGAHTKYVLMSLFPCSYLPTVYNCNLK